MKRRGIVADIDDPEQWARIRVRLSGFDDPGSLTDWCWPSAPFAGPEYGLYCLPVIGDEVWVEQSAEGDWIWTGFFWNGRNAKPATGADNVRVFRTPVGHEIKLDETGDVQVQHSNGSTAVLRHNTDIEISQDGGSRVILHQNGDIELIAGRNILLNNKGSVRCVNTRSICSYTGMPHPQGSATVFSEEP